MPRHGRVRRLAWMVAALVLCTLPLPARAGAVDGTHHIAFSAGRAWAHLEAVMAFNPRYPGTPGSNLTAGYIVDRLVDAGASVVLHPFNVSGVACANIVGKLVPANPDGTVVIVASHHDARARADRDPDPAKRSLPVPAANDGGSSTAAVLELATVLGPRVMDPGRGPCPEVWLAFFDAEDQGSGGMPGFDWIEGSRRFAAELDAFLDGGTQVSMLVLLDMIGGTGARVNRELNSDQALLSTIFAMGQCLGHGATFPATPAARAILDDHVPFIQRGIPAIDIIDLDYPQWHTTADDLAHVSTASIGAVGRTVEAFLAFKLLNATTIHDNETGRTWTPGSCQEDPWWGLVSFLAAWWPAIAAGGVVVIVALAARRGGAGKRSGTRGGVSVGAARPPRPA